MLLLLGAGVLPALSCIEPVVPETELVVTNLSRRFYVMFEVREHDDVTTGEYKPLRLMAPGEVTRVPFGTAVGDPCPGSLDFRVFVYRRVNEGVPIGPAGPEERFDCPDATTEGDGFPPDCAGLETSLDGSCAVLEFPDEAVNPLPLVAGEILDVPACDVETLVGYTVANWDAEEGVARVKFAQGSKRIEPRLRERFENEDGVWEIAGEAPEGLRNRAPGAQESHVIIGGCVRTPDDFPAPNVVVALRSFFRTRLTREGESCFVCDREDVAAITCEVPEGAVCGFSEPIAYTITDCSGMFRICRPPGGYQLEFFSDDYRFRPVTVSLEGGGRDWIFVIAEPVNAAP